MALEAKIGGPIINHCQDSIMDEILEAAALIFNKLNDLDLNQRVETINLLREELSKYSPFKGEPVDCIRWVRTERVHANDYNPNSVAPPEMELLRTSIASDGYTQPIVTWPSGGVFEVVDGFHRNRVGREYQEINDRVHDYLPIVVINQDREGRNDRIAATIRHNRARGKHSVESMSQIVLELKRRNWSNTKVARELGMDADEVLRLTQITGLAEMFKDEEFSEAWEAEMLDEADFDGDTETLD